MDPVLSMTTANTAVNTGSSTGVNAGVNARVTPDLRQSAPSLGLIVGQDWSRIDFISDLHLQPQEPGSFEAFEFFLKNTRAQALFILGDLFELWVGDDVLDAQSGDFARVCVNALQSASQRMALFLLPGNRDFLLGNRFYECAHVQPVSDPSVLQTQDKRYLLSHGDALCTGDLPYQAFRRTVRSAPWQTDFLSQPLNTRLRLAQEMRAQSMAQQRLQSENQDGKTPTYFDLDRANCTQWLQVHQCQTLIHGHTHRPMNHDLGDGLERVVLSDWDAKAVPPRLEVLRLEGNALKRHAIADCAR
jgi:UDP-2,3-diacylglucosamine hydrolase